MIEFKCPLCGYGISIPTQLKRAVPGHGDLLICPGCAEFLYLQVAYSAMGLSEDEKLELAKAPSWATLLQEQIKIAGQ